MAASLLNKDRPPVFCPGCSHDRITGALDQAFQKLGLAGSQVAIVSDIGCSGLFDTFFHTHALHGLHGRALTYAAGIKLARPGLQVVVTMGDGGQGIGGAHLLAACRRNLNLTMLVLNNFNFGMTGGQFSVTTPSEARVGSGFLNQLEKPLDICQVARSAGAAYVKRCSSYQSGLADDIAEAIAFEGFSLVDIWGICPGRYSRQNPLTPKIIAESMAAMPPADGVVEENRRPEYGSVYRKTAKGQKTVHPPHVEQQFQPPGTGRHEILLLGNAGQRIITAGEILCLAGMTAGLQATQKNEYNITVLRGPSVCEVILSSDRISFTGLGQPDVVIVLSREGVDRRKSLFAELHPQSLVLKATDTQIPDCSGAVHLLDFKKMGVKPADRALASLAVLAKAGKIIDIEMLKAALWLRFTDKVQDSVLGLVERVGSNN
ncbi:MAG: 2-oxoglutarate synthase [Deltaproteobacteria bacterium SG8_13]|nr:MAG: 2-oxoglutarate synthase [Deltaproteobacteria bacterium SG8_13]